ncbi:MAG: hypothetical protein M3Q07_05555 [Pseudobdellovibrionaceae bacterium]|nr:hypothetical protein [Pseudobdellovibrionaceae bacterium]
MRRLFGVLAALSTGVSSSLFASGMTLHIWMAEKAADDFANYYRSSHPLTKAVPSSLTQVMPRVILSVNMRIGITFSTPITTSSMSAVLISAAAPVARLLPTCWVR